MRRQEDNIKSDLKDRGREGVNSIHLDQGTSKNQTVSKTVRIFRLQKMREISLSAENYYLLLKDISRSSCLVGYLVGTMRIIPKHVNILWANYERSSKL
jgi:hypothetical protein